MESLLGPEGTEKNLDETRGSARTQVFKYINMIPFSKIFLALSNPFWVRPVPPGSVTPLYN
jgi:hypothetical protein